MHPGRVVDQRQHRVTAAAAVEHLTAGGDTGDRGGRTHRRGWRLSEADSARAVHSGSDSVADA
ncbi:MAG TPA: hypothetical protein PLL54_02295 [Dermatophilaceae bacterium]|nr:hypothetical protein [Dermatophilaceae bacterium]